MKKVILAIFALLFTTLLFVDNSYATSDYTFVLDSSTDGNLNYLCYDNEQSVGRNCSDYNYLIISPNFSYSVFPSPYNQPNFYLTITGNEGYQLYYYSFPSSTVIYSLDEFNSNPDTYTIIYNTSVYDSNSLPSGWSFDITLTDSLPGGSGGSTPTPEPCPDPEENSQYINVVLDSFWKYHKAFAGAVVAIIVIFLVYRLIKGVMR